MFAPKSSKSLEVIVNTKHFHKKGMENLSEAEALVTEIQQA